MFIREKKTKTTPVLQLVENRRCGNGKVKQEIIVSLGGAAIPDQYRREVAVEVKNRLMGYQRLVPLEYEVGRWVDHILKKIDIEGKLPPVTCKEIKQDGRTRVDGVFIDEIDHERETELGPALALNAAWQSLQLDAFLKEAEFTDRQINSAKINIFNRLLEPCSENELINWAGTVALDELLGENISVSGEDRFYRVSDKLLGIQPELEAYLRKKEQDLFNLDRIYLLYDLTNSYFEGDAKRNRKAKRSANSKEKRTDRPLLSVGLVLDREGFVITHRVFNGNMHDCRTLVRSVKDLQLSCGDDKRPVVVVDGGIATKKNLEYLRANGFDYVVNGKRTTRKEFASDFYDKNAFGKVSGRDGKIKKHVYIRRVEQDNEHIILCRSEDRKKKEDAIVSKMEGHFICELKKLKKRILKNDGKLHLNDGGDTVNRVIGRHSSKYSRAAKYYTIEYDAQSHELTWSRKDELYNEDEQLHGCYHLRSTRNDFSEDEIWKIYMTLTKVEDAFRLLKSDLGLRPFYHHTTERCEGHVWITILAYHLLRWIEYTMKLNDYDATWRSVRRMLQTHCYSTIIVSASDGIVRHIRKAGRPDERQKLIYEILGVELSNLPVKMNLYKDVKKK
jgi:hypothetical protein